jgi:anti-sigma regulatory factor (Ser/Thr protein kinase)
VDVVRLAPNERAETQARRFARNWSADHALSSRTTDDMELVVAELVSNAIRHGKPPYDLELWQTGGAIRGEVWDGSCVVPTTNPSPDEHGGYGLGIVTACTSRWGTDVVPTGKHVWFEVKDLTSGLESEPHS